jgi:hypothetical protein
MFVLMGLLGAGSLAGCHKAAGEAVPEGGSVTQALSGLQSRLGDLETRFSALRKQVEAVPPDLPGFREARATFYAIEEGRGITDAKVWLLSKRLDSALSSGKREDLRQISKEIGDTYDEVRQLDQLQIASLHQMLAFQRMAIREKGASGAGASRDPLTRP